MKLYKNVKNQYYQIKVANVDRETPDKQKIRKNEIYLRFYHPAAPGETVILRTDNVNLALTGSYKTPSSKYNKSGVNVAEQCEKCGSYFLTIHDRFCSRQCGEIPEN